MLPIVNQGLVLIIKCSVPSSATVAPFGGTKPLLTPDPMAIAYPTNEDPVIIDISASITTNNMIADKIVKNELLNLNRLLTAEGLPTNDPKEVQDKWKVMPLGGLEYGHKGFSFSTWNRGFVSRVIRLRKEQEAQIQEPLYIYTGY